MSTPADAIIAVTHRCNAHCLMCNIWKSEAADRLAPEHLAKLPPRLRTINLTGGEPFLRADLGEFVRIARERCPSAVITISTNAYLVDRIAEQMREIRRIDPGIRLAVSLDGVGAAHDTVRGDEGAFQKVMRLVDALQADGFAGLRLSMTISEVNAHQLEPVADLARVLGLELGVVAAHEATTHLQIDQPFPKVVCETLDQQVRRVTARWLRLPRPKHWLRAHFLDRTRQYLTGWRSGAGCGAGRSFFFVQADGTVYSCSVAGTVMGDLTRETWADIWDGPAARRARTTTDACRQGCWMICTARSQYRRRVLPTAWWILTHKLTAHLWRRR